MLLYHILPQSAYETLLRRGYLIGDGRRAWTGMRRAYDWMVAQMERRLPKQPRNAGKYPVWAWASWRCNQPRPDLRYGGHLPSGTPGMLLTIEIDPALVLISDFTAWHMLCQVTQGGGMTFFQAVSICFKKYATFAGRATRAEFWYWSLFSWLLSLIALAIDTSFSKDVGQGGGSQIVSTIVALATFLPSLSVTIRRLHALPQKKGRHNRKKQYCAS